MATSRAFNYLITMHSCRGAAYLVIEFADELEMPLVAVELTGSGREQDAVARLRHEEAERHGELVLDQRVLQATRRLLSVAHLRVLTALKHGKQSVSTD